MPSVAEDIDVDLGQQIQMETAAASSVNPIAIRFAFFVITHMQYILFHYYQ